MTRHAVNWQVTESGGFETAWCEFTGTVFTARGRAVGMAGKPYWLSYELATDENYVTRRLSVTVETTDATRQLELGRDPNCWTVDGKMAPELTGALDCDLAFSPLTNTMPIRRHRLHREPGQEHYLIAFVDVPDLVVSRSRQTYTHLGVTPDGGLVRFTSGDFTSDLHVDHDGLVIDYPRMAHRI